MGMAQNKALDGWRILVVEDNYLIAQDLTELLEDLGATVIGPVGWPDQALALVEENRATLNCAVLDVDLHGKKSYPIADALTGLGIRVVFTTGYDSDGFDEHYAGYPRCEKPVQAQTILGAIFPDRGL
jgi:CheY-like chemotaxis protein